MMSICFYFQVHQPYRLRRYQIFDVNHSRDYFDDQKNREVLQKVAYKCYIPTNTILLDLCKQHPDFKIAFSFSGVVLDQFQDYFNTHRAHMGITGNTPSQMAKETNPKRININHYRWEKHCRGLFELPMAA